MGTCEFKINNKNTRNSPWANMAEYLFKVNNKVSDGLVLISVLLGLNRYLINNLLTCYCPVFSFYTP